MTSDCIAPSLRRGLCRRPCVLGTPFCRRHVVAPPGRRGGWISAEVRRRRLADIETHLDISCITPPSAGGRVNGPRRSLWVGGRPPLDRDIPGFDVLALCAREIQPERPVFHGIVVRCPITDGLLSSYEVGLVVSSARIVADALRARRRVLVTCAAGLNRSALVASLALAQITRLTADDLIRIMRARRHPNALYNRHFQDLLREFVSR